MLKSLPLKLTPMKIIESIIGLLFCLNLFVQLHIETGLNHLYILNVLVN